MTSPEYLSLAEAARLIDIHPRVLRRRYVPLELVAVVIDGDLWFESASVYDLLRRHGLDW